MSEDDATPRISASFSFFRSAAEALAIRLDGCAAAKSIATMPHAYDRAGAVQARSLAKELREMAAKFESWPMADPEVVALERHQMPARLIVLQREAEELMATLPKSMPPRS